MFFITGLPRSRTQWFAEYFSAHPGVTCHHEMQSQCPNRQDFYDVMEAGGIIGNSDSGMLITDFDTRWPDAPVVIIKRPIEDVRASLRAINLVPPVGILEVWNWRMARIKGLHVAFDDIDDRLEEIHDWVGIPWDAQLIAMAPRRNVQTTQFTPNMEAMHAWRAV